MRFNELYDYVVGELFVKLPPELSYHNKRHSLDVLEVCEQKLREYKLSEELAEQLRVAALLHDIGFIRSMEDHEEHGCQIAEEILPDFDYDRSFIDEVKKMIMSTKVPQMPKSFLEMLLCDADLDYLGRSDFEAISTDLFNEMKFRGFVKTVQEWDAIQIKFLKAHQYWTKSAITKRAPKKEEHLQKLIEQFN